MDKPCTTDEFIKALCESNAGNIDYDFYGIQEAVILWNDGEYLSALTYIDADHLMKIISDEYIIYHDKFSVIKVDKDVSQ